MTLFFNHMFLFNLIFGVMNLSYILWFRFFPLDLTGDYGCVYIALWFEIEFISNLTRKLNDSCFMVFAISL